MGGEKESTTTARTKPSPSPSRTGQLNRKKKIISRLSEIKYGATSLHLSLTKKDRERSFHCRRKQLKHSLPLLLLGVIVETVENRAKIHYVCIKVIKVVRDEEKKLTAQANHLNDILSNNVQYFLSEINLFLCFLFICYTKSKKIAKLMAWRPNLLIRPPQYYCNFGGLGW